LPLRNYLINVGPDPNGEMHTKFYRNVAGLRTEMDEMVKV